MNYKDTVQWMFRQLPMYQRIGKKAYKEDLANTIALSNYLNNPQNRFKSVHIAGTNGKGSTSHILASILQEAGYKTGLYTSPHLKDFRERIKVNGVEILEGAVVDFISKNRTFIAENELSFFEMTVGMAFDYFKNVEVDIAIIETGLGGRLDSTNIINPLVSVITNIGMDHVSMLGNTLGDIAIEKAGIIKANTPVVIGETQDETKFVFIEAAKANNSLIYFADQLQEKILDSDLKGHYQIKNIKTALQTIAVLDEKGFNLDKTHIERGLQNVVKNTGLLGRWQLIGNNPKIICDTAHNAEGLQLVIEQLLKENYRQLHIVYGAVADKDLDKIIPLLPAEANYYLAKPDVERGLVVSKLKDIFDKYKLNSKSYISVSEAYFAALENAVDEDLIFVGGSTFVVAEVL